MTDATVATDVHQTLDVELYFCAEVTLDFVLGTDDLTDLTCLLVGPVFYFNVFVNTGFCQNLTGAAASNTKDVGQRNFTSLVLWEVYTNNSYCHICKFIFLTEELSLTCLELGIFLVNYKKTTFASNDYAIWCTFL